MLSKENVEQEQRKIPASNVNSKQKADGLPSLKNLQPSFTGEIATENSKEKVKLKKNSRILSKENPTKGSKVKNARPLKSRSPTNIPEDSTKEENSQKMPKTEEKSDEMPQKKGYPYPTKKNSYSGKKLIYLGDGNIINRKTKWGAIQYFILKYMSFVQVVLGLLIFCSVCCIIAIIFRGLGYKMYKTVNWKLSPTPIYHSFDDISVSSSSEFCNEFARMAIQEDHTPFIGLAYLMTACLALAEPHASGPGGDSVLLYSRNGSCEQIDGTNWFSIYADPPYNDFYIRRQRQHSGSRSAAEAGIRMPGYTQTQLGISELLFKYSNNDMSPEKMGNFTLAMYQELIQFNLHIPISARVGDALSEVSSMLGSESFKHFHTLTNTLRQEGDLFKVDPKIAHFFPLFVDSIFINDRKGMQSLIKDSNYLYEPIFKTLEKDRNLFKRQTQMEYMNQLIDDGKATKNIATTTLKNGMTICAPRELRNDNFSPHVSHALKNYTGEKLPAKGKKAIGLEFYRQIVKTFVGMIEDMQKSFKYLFYDSNMLAALTETYSQNSKQDEVSPKNGNSFTIVNHKTNEAIAWVGTLGSSFGSKIGNKNIFLNNLNDDYMKDWKNVGSTKDLIEPMIINRPDGSVHLAYAGLPGNMKISAEMGRKLTSLALHLYHNVSLEVALTAPLIQADDPKILKTRGIPYNHYSQLVDAAREAWKHHGKIMRSDIEKLNEEVSAVSKKDAMFYRHQDEKAGRRFVVMPNGL